MPPRPPVIEYADAVRENYIEVMSYSQKPTNVEGLAKAQALYDSHCLVRERERVLDPPGQVPDNAPPWLGAILQQQNEQFNAFTVQMTGQFNAFTAHMTGQFNAFTAHMTGQFNALSGEVAGLRGDVTGLREDVTGLREELTGLRGEVKDIDERLITVHELSAKASNRTLGDGSSTSFVPVPLKDGTNPIDTDLPPLNSKADIDNLSPQNLKTYVTEYGGVGIRGDIQRRQFICRAIGILYGDH